jgi:RNA polymerase sigma factor for flagellar operon FliA
MLLDAPSPTPSLAETLDVVASVLTSLDRRLPAHVSRADLASAGKLALVEALLRYDGPADEARAYCYVRVRGAVLDELRRQDPLSRHTRAQVTLVQRARAALEAELGRTPFAAEVAQAAGLTAAAVIELERIASAVQFRSADESGADGEPLHALVDGDAVCPASSAESGDAHASVRAALERLTPNHAHVLRRYYLDEATLEEISDELGLSKERVRQVREAAEKKLREDFIVLALWQSLLHRP